MEIYNAIKYHVFGRPKMSLLEAIIMIADYTEENREYDTCIECRKGGSRWAQGMAKTVLETAKTRLKAGLKCFLLYFSLRCW